MGREPPSGCGWEVNVRARGQRAPERLLHRLRIMWRERLRHRTDAGFVFLGWGAVAHAAFAKVESEGRCGAIEGASSVAARHRPGFERAEQASTDTAEPRMWRDVVQIDVSRIGDRTNREDCAPSTATRTDLSGAAIHEETMADVLLLSHRSKIVGSF